jgi:hypothetical protein
VIDYQKIFLQKTGMATSASPMASAEIDSYLDQAAFITSQSYATPWSSFDSVPEKYKYAVTLLAAIEYWWSKVSEYSSKFDSSFVHTNTVMGQKSESMFTRAMQMISALKEEIEEFDLSEGTGDIIVGDLLRRSKNTGLLVPRADDSAGNWLS